MESGWGGVDFRGRETVGKVVIGNIAFCIMALYLDKDRLSICIDLQMETRC